MDEQREMIREPAGIYTGMGPEKKNSGMGKGILTGIVVTILAGALAVAGIGAVTGTRLMFIDKSAVRGSGPILTDEAVNKISELDAYINMYYYDETDPDALRNGMYEGFLSGIGDRYSEYYTAEAYQQTQVSMMGEYYGIGAGLQQDKETMVVSIKKVYEGTPSDAAGLREGDVILSVDDTDATSMDVTDLVLLIRGEAGTTVHLEIYRESTAEYLSFDVERADVTLPSVSHEMLENGIGYIRIESFEKATATQFEEALHELESQGMEKLMIDLRYNGGGLVNSVVDILDLILPEGLLVYIEDKNGNRSEYHSDAERYISYPMVVLINGESASASEIFAGAIKDYEYGTLIGTKTFGKGIVQTVFPLSDGDAVKLTTAKYFTPNGNYIHEVGIEPDLELKYEYLDPEGEEYEMQYDNQILKGIEVLNGSGDE